jgi:hypothetical protein
VAVAVNTTGVRVHTGFEDTEMDIPAVNTGRTLWVMALDVAGDPVAHVSDEVSTHVMTSLLAGKSLNVGLFPPTMFPFLFHW